MDINDKRCPQRSILGPVLLIIFINVIVGSSVYSASLLMTLHSVPLLSLGQTPTGAPYPALEFSAQKKWTCWSRPRGEQK